MSARKWIVACAALGMSAAALGSNANGISLTHHEPLERLSLQAKGAESGEKIVGVGPIELKFDALGKSFDLQLEPNAGLLTSMSQNQFVTDVVPYRGRVNGVPGSWARIVIANGMPAGLVWDGKDLYAIEVPGDSIVGATSPITYRLADVIIAPGALSCAGGASMTSGAAMYTALVGNLNVAMARAAGAVSEIDIGVIGDADFTNDFDDEAAAETALLTRLNNVDGIFSEQVGVQINVPLRETFTAANDPFTGTTDSGVLLEELEDYRTITPIQRSQGLTHLFTGRNLDGSTVGIAYLDALCRPWGAGLSQGSNNATFDSLVAAHEIGHNFGAPHDGEPPDPENPSAPSCENEPETFLMAPFINSSDQFSACSISIIQANVATASCITALPSTDISIAFNGPQPTVLITNVAAITFDIVNNGTEVAENVAVDITLPNNVSFISATGPSASCTNGAVVNCQFGDIAGSSATEVTVNVDTITVGTGDFDATVTADADANNSNNTATAQLTVNQAVSLVVLAPAPVAVTLDQATAVSVTLANQAVLGATGVSISVSLDAGLRADTASWSIGSCLVTTGQQIDCAAAAFDGQSESVLSFDVTGLTTGSKSYTVTVTPIEADTDVSNNSADGTVIVTAVSGGNSGKSDSGGGGIGLVFLGLLGCCALRAFNLAAGLATTRS